MRERRMIPLKLTWGITVHKAQGLTVKEGASMDITGNEGSHIGRFFVALSRVPGRDKLRLINCMHMDAKMFADLRRRAGKKGRWKPGWIKRSREMEKHDRLDRETAETHNISL